METNQPPWTVTWRKSSYTGNTGGDCVEVANLTALAVAAGTWTAFLHHLK
ncbi:DUF397 domain-containing protein [Streptomyces shenzhenensis]